MKTRVVCVAVLVAAGCGRGGAPAQPAPSTVEESAPPEGPITAEQAQAWVDALDRRYGGAAAEPASLDDVEVILKRDDLSAFAAGVALARSQEGERARVLEAQIELAWSEAYLLLMEVWLRLQPALEERAAQPGAPMWFAQEAQRVERLAEALQLASISHATRGAELAYEVMAQYPDSYLGYRLAGDYLRTVGDWAEFDAMIEKVRARNPNSNGLVFLLGAAAWAREGDAAAAQAKLDEALAKDPQFVRCLAHGVLIQPDVERTFAAIARLEGTQPQHALVRWTHEARARLRE